jgi:hypothetical protein
LTGARPLSERSPRPDSDHRWSGSFLGALPIKDGLTIGFQRGTDAELGKTRLHLVLTVEDLDAAAEVDALGARSIESGKTRDLEDSGVGPWPIPRTASWTSTTCPSE